MAEEQNQDNVTLADILDEVKRQHRDSKLFAAYVLGCAVALIGVSFWVASYHCLLWQKIDAWVFIALGTSLMAYTWMKMRKLREEQKQKKGT